VVVRVGVNDVAENGVADVGRFDARALHRFLHAFRGELARRNVLQAATIASDGGSRTAQHDDFTFHRIPPIATSGRKKRPRLEAPSQPCN
jgi:hypothetical protein